MAHLLRCKARNPSAIPNDHLTVSPPSATVPVSLRGYTYVQRNRCGDDEVVVFTDDEEDGIVTRKINLKQKVLTRVRLELTTSPESRDPIPTGGGGNFVNGV